MRQALAAPLRRRGKAVPAGGPPRPVCVAPAGRHDDGAILEDRAFAVPDTVQRCQHLRREPTCFREYCRDVVGGEIAIDPFREGGFEAGGVPCDTMVLDGLAAEEICRVAHDHGARLVVVGAHGWGRFGRIVHGSVSTAVLHARGAGTDLTFNLVTIAQDQDAIATTTARWLFLAFAIAFAVGAGLAGLGGVIGGSFASLAPGLDANWLLYSLVVVIIGGMGSLGGAAIGALLLGLTTNLSAAYLPSSYTYYSIIFTFILVAIVLAVRPLGLFGRPA